MFSAEILILPPFCSSTKLFATVSFPKHITEGSPAKIFGTARKKIDKKSWHGPPKHNIFRYFSILEISDTLEGSPTIFFGTVRQNVFGRMSWYSPPRPSRPQTYSFPEFFRNAAQKGSPAMFFGTERQKNSTKNRDIFLLSIKFFDTRNQWHPRQFPYEFFGTVRQNVFGRKFRYSPRPSRPQTYSLPETFRNATQKGSPAMFFGTARQKIFQENRDIFLLGIKFFDPWNQWHHRRFPYEFIRHCETKRFRQNFLILPTPSFSSTNFFATGNFPKHITERFPFKVFGTARQKNRQKSVT